MIAKLPAERAALSLGGMAPINGTLQLRRAHWLVFAAALFGWLVGIPLVHGVLPWAISQFGPRYGWSDGGPGIWNLLGLVPIVVSAFCLIWVMALHFAHSAEWRGLELTPRYLLTRGPYAYTRNPIYLSEIGLWLGWSLFYCGAAVPIGLLLLLPLSPIVVRREERALEARFAEAYLHYKAEVPRWLGGVRNRLAC